MSIRRDVNEGTGAALALAISTVLIGLAVLILIGLGRAGSLAALPWVRAQETEINRSSQGYIEAKQLLLVNLTQDAYRLISEIDAGRANGRDTSAQQAHLDATIARIEHEASLIPRESIPIATRNLMIRFGRYL